jgi:secondary thiamine-phosphate synthase enzyme
LSGGDDDGHDHGDEDPHFWHDPLRMADLGDAVADQLAELDPENAEEYQANAVDLRTDLEQLDSEFAEGLSDCERDVVVVSHDAFRYLQKYDLRLAAITGLTLNENADPSVRRDFETHFNRMVPENMSLFEHTLEGPDDMTSHIKSSLLGHSVTFPITNGRPNLGTWQGIYLCEHRNRGGSRKLVVTVMG